MIVFFNIIKYLNHCEIFILKLLSENLPAEKRAVLHKVAEWVSAIVINVNLRELLVYPLIRDQLHVSLFLRFISFLL